MIQLTDHFSLEELTLSATAQRLGIDNKPSILQVGNLTALASTLEAVRDLLNVPIHIDSGFRSFKLNKAVGGSVISAHLDGLAADFTAVNFGSPKTIVQAIAGSNILFDQLIQEGTWVHLSIDPRRRRQVLTANFGPDGTRYILDAA